jgi:hypothetical protein
MSSQHLDECMSVHQTAVCAYHAGINVIPVRADGSKRPALDGWKIYQQRRVSLVEIHHWFQHAERGIAVVTGEISGNLEVLDIDSPETYRVWLECVRKHPLLRYVYERIASGYLEATPGGGRHLLYRCETVGRNQSLARSPLASTQGYQTLLETRGTGGLLVIAPSNGQVHESGRPYTLLHGGFAHIATITSEERSELLSLARTFDETPVKIREERAVYETAPPGLREMHPTRPGDLFNQLARWEDILCPHGWILVRMVDGAGQWRRPGKRGPGISATTNYAGSDLLYVFSTSTIFEPERGYTKFSAYTLLEHNGDFSAAARALAEEGYVPDR